MSVNGCTGDTRGVFHSGGHSMRLPPKTLPWAIGVDLKVNLTPLIVTESCSQGFCMSWCLALGVRRRIPTVGRGRARVFISKYFISIFLH